MPLTARTPPPPKIRTYSTFPSTLLIDGIELDVLVKRMTNTEFDAFADDFARWSDPRGPEESPEARRERETEAASWMRAALDDYLQIVSGQLEHDGASVTKGGQLLDIYGGRLDVAPQALSVVYMENRVGEAQKKTYRSALASRLGLLSALQPAAPGNALDSTVGNAEAPDSAPRAGATAPSRSMSSGMTDRSSSGPARSARSRRK